MPDLEPKTRQEMIMSGEDLTPVTREEMILAGVEVTPVTRKEIAYDAYLDGGDIDLQDITITENGEVTAPSGVAYKKITTEVPIPTPPENAYLLEEYEDVPTDIASFTASDAPLKSLTASIEPLQSGSGDPSPTNVRPISGWTSCVVNRTGKNLLKTRTSDISTTGITVTVNKDSDDRVVSFTASGKSIGNANLNLFNGQIDIPSDSYIFSITNSLTISDGTGGIYLSTKTGREGTRLATAMKSGSTTFTNKLGTVWLYVSNGATVSGTISIMLRKATVLDDTFEPYNGQTTTIPFTDSQGNPVEVYGGSVDVVNGGEQPNRYVKKTLYDAWSVASNGVFYLDGKATDGKVGTLNTEANVLCSIYPKGLCIGASSGAIQNPKTLCIQELNGIRFLVYDTSFESLEDFNAYVAQNGIEIRYELATPTTFYTQPTAVKSLDGENNVFASTGDVEELKYFSKEAE